MPYLPHTNPDHDEELVARLAADDLAADERDAQLTQAWVAECPACAELARDIRAIASATAALPPPRRTRDFRLTEADAARLRPAGWRGFVRRFGSPTFAFTRPLAAGLATLGIAGLLLATLPSGFGFASSSSGALSAVGNSVGAQDSNGDYLSGSPEPGVLAPEAAPSAGASARPAPGSAAPAPAPTAAPSAAAAPAAGPTSGSGRDVNGSPLPATGGGAGVATEGGGSKGLTSSPNGATGGQPAEAPPGPISAQGGSAGGPSPLVLLSITLLVAGLGLGALRIVARRIA